MLNVNRNNIGELPRNIALVHEWFSPKYVGGAENVVKEINDILFELGSVVQLFSLVDAESDLSNSWLFKKSVKTSFVQNLPFGRSHVQYYLPLLPMAIEQLNLDEFPLVVSSNHLVAKGVLTSPDQLHVSYVHTPVRYAWDQMNIYLQRSLFKRLGLEPFIRWQLHRLRQWDQVTSSRADFFLANSRFTARRISKYWRRDSEVVYPPVSVECFDFNKPRDDYFLCVCRLVPNKRVDILVRAFNQLQLPLIVVGQGPEMRSLKQIAGPSVRLMGYQSKDKVTSLMENCRAFVYSGVEDFGIAPVEAMAAGAPVIAYGKGGLLDTVKCIERVSTGATGLLFPHQTVSSLVEAINIFNEKKLWRELTPESIRVWANNFSRDSFKLNFQKALLKAWKTHQRSCDIGVSGLDSFSKRPE